MAHEIQDSLERLQQELDQLRTRVDNLSSLIEVSIIINSTLDLDEVINLVMEKAQAVMDAEASSVMLINEKTGLLECEVALGEVGSQVKEKIMLKMGEGIAGWVAQTGEPVIVPDAPSDPRFARQIDEETGFHTKSILAVPLKVKDRVIGVAEVINRKDGQPFTEDDLHLFSTFGRQVALAIENARMHKFMLEKQKLEQQLEAARIIQESFMPQTFPVSRKKQFEVAAKSLPAASIGGDFYDFIEYDPHTLGMVMGDVSGKGVPAALYMARLVSDFRFHTQIERNVSRSLSTINDLLVDRGRRGMFVTLQYIVVNLDRGTADVATAGHLPAIHLHNGGRKISLIDQDSGIPLGILSGVSYQSKTIQMDHGDFLICFTDGIVEAKNRHGEQFSLQRLINFLNQSWTHPDEIVEQLIRQVHRFVDGAEQHDDLTVLAFKWC